ncbi:sporulation integral membrane protein YtvI [Pseudogracilibacillus auburnensis]|uniref:Sporulation integral membrane protein YtvI n=1 Tax=Pseudogracilibacillus auburnensis TaxID=1494959 RepID=A0A2V3VUF6_9BACI|nr:sporulation integral membrane protein YtvI [Pseudogracilibacillus auburnensis]MBO1004499.1 sporulation integral membrane protein YtvI [Pseudogracilibacillus auburnensis]PXW85296.1 sporulation integral membrane protein YtvI [Pseudogracilibacillus auburnensis]
MNNTLYFQIVRAFLVLLILLCIYFFLKYLFLYIYPFFIAVLIAFVLHPLVTLFELKWRMNRGIATFFVMSSFFTLFITICFFSMKQLLHESTNLVQTLPEHVHRIHQVLSNIGQTFIIPYYEKITSTFPFLPRFEEWKVDNYLHLLIDELGSSSSIFVKNIVLTTSNILASLSYIGTILLFILIASFIMTKDLEEVKGWYKKIVPIKITKQLGNIMNHLKRSVFGFIKAQIIITFISSIIVFIGLFIFQIDHIFTITLTIFFVDFIPYVGIGFIFIPWIVYTFITSDYVLTIQLATLYIIIIIIRQLIEPRILASSIGIHPLIAIIILFIGIQSLGIVGIFMTPIILILISAIYHAGIVHYVWYFVKNG